MDELSLVKRFSSILLLFLALASTSIVASASLSLSYRVADGVITVSNTYYSIVIDSSRGVSISSWSTGGLTIKPHLAIDFCSNAGNAGYPLLSEAQWSHEVIATTKDFFRVLLKPSETTCLNPLAIEVYLTFTSWSPSISVLIVVRNTGDEPVTLTGSNGAPAITISLDAVNNTDASLVMVDSNGLRVIEDDASQPAIRLEMIVLSRTLNGSPVLFYGLSGGFLGDYSLVVYEEDDRVASAVITLAEAVIPPNSSRVYSFSIAVSQGDPLIASLAGFTPAYASLDPEGYNMILDVLPLREHLDSVEKSISEMTREVENLTARVDELEALVRFLQDELKIKDEIVENLNSRIEKQNTLLVGVLALGVLTGMIGGVIAYKARLELTHAARTAKRR